MQYRKFGKLDWQASAIGFGCMRLPTKEGQIDEPEAIRMIRYAIDHGVTYFDTAYGYHDGNSERVLGKALQNGYRARIHLATKLPCWNVNVYEDMDRLLNEQLAKLQTDHIDFYLLHGLNAESWHKVRDLGVIAWLEGAIADGRIRHPGFSFHDKFDVFKEIIDAYDKWAMCQIQYNYMDEEEQAGTKGLEYAAAKGLAVVVMEPLLGGKLANPPQSVQALWDAMPTRRRAADWALQWLWSKPQASVVLSGMSTMEQVEQNIASAEVSRISLLTPAELAVFAQVRDAYKGLCPIPCTGCRYCMPCPNGVDIPRNFAMFNEGVMYNAFEQSRQGYSRWLPEAARANVCIQCRECEPKCPQKIPISEWMPVVHQVLGEGQSIDTCQLPA